MQHTDTVEPVSTASNDLARRVQSVYEKIDPDNLDTLREIYARDVSFEDPIHAIQGLDALIANFQSLFANVERCRFKFHRSVVSGDGIFFSWTMMLEHKTFKRDEVIRVEGASYLKYRHGKIYYHRDYFDLGAMVYENIPVMGGLIRAIRSRIAA